MAGDAATQCGENGPVVLSKIVVFKYLESEADYDEDRGEDDQDPRHHHVSWAVVADWCVAI